MSIPSFRVITLELVLVLLAFLAMLGWVVASPSALVLVVDRVRNVVGPEPIAFAENILYGVEDSAHHLIGSSSSPSFWSPATSPAIHPTHAAPSATEPDRNVSREWSAPRSIIPVDPDLATAGEGTWMPIPNSFDPTAAPLMYKTFLHPDPARAYAQVAMVAMDATRLRLHVIAGTREPVSSSSGPRPGLIPSPDLPSLVAAFNGGFKAIHGHHGMMVDGQTLLAPQLNSDTIALYQDGSVRIKPWSVISNTLPLMQSFRQTPAYLVWQGQINPDLQNEQIVAWGKSVSGKTAIWRSGLGISADGRTLYYAAGESLTAQSLARALVAAGASDVAELDVNWSFERFLMYTPSTGNYTEKVLLDQMVCEPGMYVSRPAQRDFMYLTLGQ